MSRACGGHGLCGKCRVKQPGWPVLEADRRILKDLCDEGWRLACVHGVKETVQDEQILAAASGLDESDGPAMYGSLDIGTTTVVLVLLDEAGRKTAEYHWANPQRAWGADVLSRIEKYGQMDPDLIHNLVYPRTAGLKRLVVTGNTVMTHLWMHVDPGPLAKVPFAIPVPHEVHRQINGCCEIVCAPLAAYVGADIRTGLMEVLAAPHAGRFLFMDLGTNGELALYDHGKVTVCAAACGPALEGAGISVGMAALPGAVWHVDAEDGWRVRTIGDGDPAGVCGSGLFSWIDALRRENLLRASGKLKECPDISGLRLTQKDIRMFQLAKGALQAAWELLVPAPESLEEVYIAGGFSLGLDEGACIRLGLFHPAWKGKVRLCGNMALKGACRVAVNGSCDTFDASVVQLETDPRFTDVFARAMLLQEAA